MDLAHIFSVAQDIGAALLMVLGGLKVIARYTPFDWDDKALAVVEAPLTAIVNFFKKP
jgi:hypothetical protein